MKAKETDNKIKEEKPENIRRNFLKKFGKYAATVPVITFTLMSPIASSAIGSGGGSGSNS